MTYDSETLRHLARRFAERAAATDATGEISLENLADLREAGLLALTVDPKFGGYGKGLREIVDVIGTIAQGDPSTALILSMQYLQHAGAASSEWPESTLQLISKAAVREGALINALRVEPDLGTPSRGGVPSTKLRHDGNRWTVNGRKIYSTGSTALRWGVVWVATDEEVPKSGQVLVPLDAPGVTIERSWNHLGMRATGSHTVIFENVEIPREFVLDLRVPEEWRDRGENHAAWHAVIIGALYNGVARAAREWLIAFLRERAPSNLGKPLATLPRFHELLGEIDALLLTNTSLIDDYIRRQEEDRARATDANLVKYIVTENAIHATERGLAAIGNPALSRENPLERHYRNVLCARIHTPQADVALAAAGRAAFAEAQP
ncbi:acyl-CoA dehydrogenase family protein [Kozakia baliensis]|uniref:acyl-CoA dehydrogenase family protein n=1 Tax=Kozakia baliensis TaxID=153496 RepID=UPI00345B976F